jgi:methylated-DNA-[protein]-cysteine S-methyltransferase
VNPSPTPPRTAASRTVRSPLGPIRLEATPDRAGRPAIIGARFLGAGQDPTPGLPNPNRRAGPLADLLDAAARQLAEHLSTGRVRFLVPLAPAGTRFQRRVWALLRRIEPGRTTSYAALARRLGRPGAARAVGLANARNPIAVLIPCHRVVAADGSLGGYAAGTDRKRRLLDIEGSGHRPIMSEQNPSLFHLVAAPKDSPESVE